MPIKKIIIQGALGAFRGLVKLGVIIKNLALIIWQIVRKLFRLLFWDALVFLYRQYLKIKKIILPSSAAEIINEAEKEKRIGQKKSVASAVVLIIALFVLINNLQIKNAYADELSKKSVIYKLANSMAEFPEEIIDEEFYLDEFAENSATAPDDYLKILPQLDPTDIYEDDLAVANLPEGNALIKPIISTEESTTKARDRVVYHPVQAGETISVIAEQYGISVNTILWANNLTANSYIKPGQNLKILPVSGITHKVAKNETLDKIAEKYKVEKEKILSANKITDATTILLGEELMIPGGRPPYTPPPAKTYAASPNYSSAKISQGKLQWPTNSSRITQYYSWRHQAVDFGNKIGQPVYAAEAGIVTQALYSGWNGGYGLKVVIDHGNGRVTVSSHFSKVYVAKGEKVSRGQVIGEIGSTGRSTGPHLHFEYRVNGSKLNPLTYLK